MVPHCPCQKGFSIMYSPFVSIALHVKHWLCFELYLCAGISGQPSAQSRHAAEVRRVVLDKRRPVSSVNDGRHFRRKGRSIGHLWPIVVLHAVSSVDDNER